MKVNALDHVNIITADLEGSARFYAEVFELDRRDAPAPLTPNWAQWMYDGEGRAIFHINSTDCPRAFDREVSPGATGSIHHVALNCVGHAELTDRLTARGISYQMNTVDSVGLRQVFAVDPNGVLLELNFWGD